MIGDSEKKPHKRQNMINAVLFRASRLKEQEGGGAAWYKEGILFDNLRIGIHYHYLQYNFVTAN